MEYDHTISGLQKKRGELAQAIDTNVRAIADMYADIDALDAALMVGLLIAGQMVASLVFDHFGLLSYDVNRINLWRVGGVALICLGVFVIQRN